jgi:hypothetical protein
MPNGLVPSMTGSTWSIVSGVTKNNPDVPAGEMLANTGFDVDTGSWASDDGTIASVGGGQSGNCCAITRVAGAVQTLRQAITTVVGGWYQFSIYLTSGSTGAETGGIRLQSNAFVTQFTHTQTSSASWVKLIASGRSTATAQRFRADKTSATVGTMLYDTASAMRFTDPTLVAISNFSSPYGAVKTTWTRGANSAACFGSVMCSSYDKSNLVIAYHNGRDAVLMDKCVNGTWTNLLSSAATYGAGRNVILKRLMGTNTFQALYGVVGSESQIGADQTISDTSIIGNTHHGLFDASIMLNSCSKFIYSAAG